MKYLSLILLLVTSWIFQPVQAQDVLIPTNTNNEFTFKPDNFPTFDQRDLKLSSYRYFWNFGDGNFKLLDSANTNAASNVSVLQAHGYAASSSPYQAKLAITQIYSKPVLPDDDVEQAESASFSFGSVTEPISATDVDLLGGSLMIQPVREPRPGYPITFIVTYELDNCIQAFPSAESWEFSIYYNSFILEQAKDESGASIDYVEAYNDEVFESIAVGGGVDKLVIRTTASSSEIGQHHFFLHFDVSEDAPIGQPLDMYGTVGGIAGMMALRACDSYFLPDMHVVKSYDPNYKLVSRDTITTNPAQTLHYVIRFQNTGDGPTDSIRIEDFLDPRLDPATLALTAVRIGYQHIPLTELISNPDPVDLSSALYDWLPGAPTPVFDLSESQPVGTHYVWKFANAKLKGIKQAGFGEDFSELETTGSIEFDIKTKFFVEYGIIIKNAAHIYFDDNAVVTTEPAQTAKFCCDEAADTTGLLRFSIANYVDTLVFNDIKTFTFSTDSLDPNEQPYTEVNPITWTCEYGASKSFEGLDILSLIVCDPNGTCDTVNIHICSNTNQALANYPCDRTGVFIDRDFSPHTFAIFPNPTSDKLWVEGRGATYPIRQLDVYNAQGQLVRQKNDLHSLKASIYLAELPSGMYILHINDKWTQKIIKR